MPENRAVKPPSLSLMQRFSQASVFTKTAFVLGGLAAIFVVTLLGVVFFSLITGDAEDVAALVTIVRDLFIILMAMQGMLVCLALAVIILQIAALVNVFQNGTRPILQDLKKSSQTVRGTSEFLSENLTTPVIESKAWLAGAVAFLRELRGLYSQVKPRSTKSQSQAQAEGEVSPDAEQIKTTDSPEK